MLTAPTFPPAPSSCGPLSPARAHQPQRRTTAAVLTRSYLTRTASLACTPRTSKPNLMRPTEASAGAVMDTKRQPCPFRFGLTSTATPSRLHARCCQASMPHSAGAAPAQDQTARQTSTTTRRPWADRVQTRAILGSTAATQSNRATVSASCIVTDASTMGITRRHPRAGGWRRVPSVPRLQKPMAPKHRLALPCTQAGRGAAARPSTPESGGLMPAPPARQARTS